MLVLSLFPGIGLLDRAFEDQGFCVVRGPDLLWGGDVRSFHPPAERFDGLIGGPPCQARSRLRHLVAHNARTKGYQQAVDLMPEFVRCVEQAQPRWWLCENVPTDDRDRFPDPDPAGYEVQFLELDNRWAPEEEGGLVGAVQRRRRWFWFGSRDGTRLRPRVALWDNPTESVMVTTATATLHGSTERLRVAGPVTASAGHGAGHGRAMTLEVSDRACATIGGSGKRKRSHRVTGINANGTVWDPERQGVRGMKTEAYFRAACLLQGLPEEFDLPGFKVSEKIRAVGNGVPYPLARMLAAAVREALA